MKPRQTVKNCHNSNVPLSAYQQQQQRQQQQQHHYQNSPIPTSAALLKDIELAAKLGLNPDDMPNLQATTTIAGASSSSSNMSSQEEIIKCLQTIYDKNSSAEILQKISAIGDWPMQSVSPPEAPRPVGSTIVGGNSSSSIGGSMLTGSGNINNNNNNNNINNSSGSSNHINIMNQGHQNQDVSRFSNNTKQHPLPTTAINHNLRLSSTALHMPQQPQLSQQKSVLSLHQHQSDLSNRRMNYHNMSTTNASFANLSAPSTSANVTTLNTSSLDTNSLVNPSSSNIFNSKNSSSVSHNIIDNLGSIDNIFSDEASIQSSTSTNKDTLATSQQSLNRHQQLQKLLKATNSQVRSSSSPSSSTSMNRNESQRNNTTLNYGNMTQGASLPITSSPSSSSTPSQAFFSSVPKSLLNLAACSSSVSTSTSSNPESRFSSMVNQLNLRSSRVGGSSLANLTSIPYNSNSANPANSSNINNNNTIGSSISNNTNLKSVFTNNSATNVAGDFIDEFTTTKNQHNQNNPTPADINRTSTSTVNNNATSSSKSTSSKQKLWSLLSDDQTWNSGRSNLRSSVTGSSGVSYKTSSQAHQRNQPRGSSSKDFLADFQERAARAGISIGELSKPSQVSTQSTNTNTTSSGNLVSNQFKSQQQILSISPNLVKDELINSTDTKEIESALSRVEARNDLSLLYPPMLLASNSQKKINALSAGLKETDDSELFTREVKKIILEECNIIYECKACSNLFRSLANLIKHKRTYCLEHHFELNSMDINKRSSADNLTTGEQSLVSVTVGSTQAQQDVMDIDQDDDTTNTSSTDGSRQENLGFKPHTRESKHLKTSDRSLTGSDLRMTRLIRNNGKRNMKEVVTRLKNSGNLGFTTTNNSLNSQTNLSRILQSQPKNRSPLVKSGVLAGPSNVSSGDLASDVTHYNVSNSMSNFETDKTLSYSSNDEHEQLVRNSSLAKTLLNEKVRISNPKQSPVELPKVLVEDPQPPTCSSSSNNDSDSDQPESKGAELDTSPYSESKDIDQPSTSDSPVRAITPQSQSQPKANNDPVPSSSSAGSSGGIMKLKIQLKTRPDEKSKVYEIV